MRSLVGGLLIGISSIAAAQDVPRVTADTALIRFAASVVEQAGAVDAAWPGFWTAPRFVLHRSSGEALIYTQGLPFAGAVRITDPSVPEVLRRNAYSIDVSKLPASGRIIRGDPTPYILELTGIDVPIITFLLHESFHMWQASFYHEPLFSHCVPQSLPADLPEPGAFSSRLALEVGQLATAIGADTSAARLDAIREYLGLRRERWSKAPASVSHTEQRQERQEGTAELVGKYGALIMATGSVQQLPDSITASLRRVESALEQSGRANVAPGRRTLAGTYWYSTGAAIAYLLDELQVRNWRARVVDGAKLDELLAETIADKAYLDWTAARPAIRTLCP